MERYPAILRLLLLIFVLGDVLEAFSSPHIQKIKSHSRAPSKKPKKARKKKQGSSSSPHVIRPALDLNKVYKDSSSYVLINVPETAQIKKIPLQSLYQSDQEKLRFVFIVPSFNNAAWYKKNLTSIFSQKYSHYHVIYIDDASTDGTAELVERFVKEKGMEKRFTLIQNKNRKYMAYNRYMAVHLCAGTDICIALDGDDWLKNEQVLSCYNKVYKDKNVWMTYGSYINFPSGEKRSYSAPIAGNIIEENKIRSAPWKTSHLKTFYAWLFQQINEEHFKYHGSFLDGATDIAMMFPMLEMAGFYSKFIATKTYVYNCTGFSSEVRTDIDRDRKEKEHFLRAQPPFQPIYIGQK